MQFSAHEFPKFNNQVETQEVLNLNDLTDVITVRTNLIMLVEQTPN